MSTLLENVKVLEFQSIGPVPWAVSMLAEMGAEITCVARPGSSLDVKHHPIFSKNREFVELDVNVANDRRTIEQLIAKHDVLVEGMRPGVMERLGLSPQICREINPKIVYARLSGWGRQGPYANKAGHDINYLSLTGALHAIGKKSEPSVPLNIIGDYGGGGANLVIGILGGLFKARETGIGMIVDVPMFEGIFKQLAFVFYNYQKGSWVDERESNAFDGGTPWYRTYKTQCGGFMAVGALEEKFYMYFVELLDLDINQLPSRSDRANWNVLANEFSDAFMQKTRNEWCAIFESADACVTPVLSLSEALEHPHNLSAGIFQEDKHGNLTIKSTPTWSQL
ncbi:MAG: CoA transferase [Burkholderiaceae bacterium]|nr:CoA transferase [Burkholderiaceae bacterium]